MKDNFCRNPNGDESIWCYTITAESTWSEWWEYCDPMNEADLKKKEVCSGTNCSGYRGY